jgi:hypothetical protein
MAKELTKGQLEVLTILARFPAPVLVRARGNLVWSTEDGTRISGRCVKELEEFGWVDFLSKTPDKDPAERWIYVEVTNMGRAAIPPPVPPIEIVREAVEAVPAANARRLLEKVREEIPGITLEVVEGLATKLVLNGIIQAHGDGEGRRYYPFREVKAEDLDPGTGFDVLVHADGQFSVRVYYRWDRRGDGFNGAGIGATFSQAATMAIQDAEGDLELEEDPG